MRSNSLSTLSSCQLQDLQNVGNISKSMHMRSNSLSTLSSCQLQDLQHLATIIKYQVAALTDPENIRDILLPTSFQHLSKYRIVLVTRTH
jgi:hypothetical protein